MMTNASVQLRLDRVALGRLAALGYLRDGERDPGAIRDAVWSALADRLAPAPVSGFVGDPPATPRKGAAAPAAPRYAVRV